VVFGEMERTCGPYTVISNATNYKGLRMAIGLENRYDDEPFVHKVAQRTDGSWVTLSGTGIDTATPATPVKSMTPVGRVFLVTLPNGKASTAALLCSAWGLLLCLVLAA
jgi:hypothetical protein